MPETTSCRADVRRLRSQARVFHHRRPLRRHLGTDRALTTRPQLLTVAALIATGSTEQLPRHLARAQANGLTQSQLKEVITHLAFYAGWPKAMSALTIAKQVLND